MTDQLPAERPRISATAMTMQASTRGAVPMPVSFGEVIALADVMSRSQHAIPKHLRENPGACLAVTMQAMRWEMDPFAVASKTYSIKDQVAYEAQVIAAVVNTRSGLMRRPSITYRGEGPTRQCIVSGEFMDGADAVYESPEIGKITTKNSPLWNSDPDQQLAYFSLRSFARRHCPEVILGVYDRDEILESEVRDVTPNAGTGLLAKLQSTTENVVHAEGFGIRDIDAEVTPEPKKRAPRKAKATNLGSEMLDATGEAEPEIVQQVVEDHADGVDTVEATENAPETPAEAQVEDVRTVDTQTAETVADGHAEPGEGYFHADKAAFPSGRRVWYVDGVEQKDTADDGTLPVYAEHAPAMTIVQTEGQSTDSETTENAVSGAEKPTTTEAELGFDAAPSDPFRTFDAAFAVSHSWEALRPHLVELGKTEAWRARPHDAVKVRQLVAEMIDRWNENGAKLDPAEDAWLFQCFVASSDDVEAIQGTLALVQSAEWFSRANETQQASIVQFVMHRVKQIGGA